MSKKDERGTCVAEPPAGGATQTLDGVPARTAPPGAAPAAGTAVAPRGRAGSGRTPSTGRVAAERFELEREVGRGGMATIYLARDRERADRAAAVKVIHPHLSGDEQLVQRFLHEVRAHVGLVHPNVVEMLGWGRDGQDRLFMAMEFVDGPMLKELMARRRRFPVDLAVHVAASVLKGLAAAHAAGIVHRDVKPANVMVTRSGRVKVADFGISKAEGMTQLTSTGNVIGTPAYMSPEQALGRELDERSDLFSVGVFLYEMLLGGNPFLASNPATTLQRVVHLHQRPVFESCPTVPARLEKLVEALLKKVPAERPESAIEAARELLAIAEEECLAASDEAMAAFAADPEKTSREFDRRRARRHFELGLKAYDQGRGTVEGALWELFLASSLDPSHAEARTWLEQLSSQQGYHLQRRSNERIEELEAKLKEDPDQLHVVLQLAKLHKAQGNFLQVIFYYKRAKALRPPDRYTQGQIETLVNARAVPIIDGTGVFETQDHVPVRLRPARPEPEALPSAGWGGFLGAFLASGAGKVAALAGGLVAAVLVVGSFIDSAVVASPGESGPRVAPTGDPGFDREIETLARAQSHAESGDHAKAEELLRRFLDDYPASFLRSEALFRLGDALERQGRRPEALSVHEQNAYESGDDWALRSQHRRAELFLLDDSRFEARLALEDLAGRADGERRLEALIELAELDRLEGNGHAASYSLEALVTETEGSELHDRARLGLAATYEDLGEPERARELYAAIRDSTDHAGAAFAEASEGLERLSSGG